MTKKRFQEFLSYLCNQYNRQIDEMASNAYFEAAQGIADEDARKLYNDVLGNCKYFPSLVEFKEIVSMNKKDVVPLKNTQRCFYCMDAGTIAYTKKGVPPFQDYPYTYLARCPMCNNGKLYSSWISFDQVFDQKVLEEIKQKNIERFGSITVSQEKAAQIAARAYQKQIVGGKYGN